MFLCSYPPCLPRARWPPKRLDTGSEPHAYETPKDYYKQIYFEILDVLLNEISRRFDQATLKYPTCIEIILLKAANMETYQEITVDESLL